jgi:predicted CopG family antitoxin
MQRKLTITIADDVYRGLHQRVGRGEISRFIENLVRPHVTTDTSLEDEYHSAALDSEAEREAFAWIESNVDEALE